MSPEAQSDLYFIWHVVWRGLLLFACLPLGFMLLLLSGWVVPWTWAIVPGFLMLLVLLLSLAQRPLAPGVLRTGLWGALISGVALMFLVAWIRPFPPGPCQSGTLMDTTTLEGWEWGVLLPIALATGMRFVAWRPQGLFSVARPYVPHLILLSRLTCYVAALYCGTNLNPFGC